MYARTDRNVYRERVVSADVRKRARCEVTGILTRTDGVPFFLQFYVHAICRLTCYADNRLETSSEETSFSLEGKEKAVTR